MDHLLARVFNGANGSLASLFGSKLELRYCIQCCTGAVLSYCTTEPWAKDPLEELGPHETRVSPPLESTSGCDPANIPKIDVKGKGAGVGTVGREVIPANRWSLIGNTISRINTSTYGGPCTPVKVNEDPDQISFLELRVLLYM